MIRRLAALALIFVCQVAATAPPPVIAAHIKDDAINLADLSWLKGALPDATPADKAAWAPVEPWVAACATQNATLIKTDLAALGVTAPEIHIGPGGSPLCGAVARMSWVAKKFSDWPSLKAAADEADRYFVAYSYAAGAGAESVPFDPKWAGGEDALSFLHATVREQFYRRGMAWRAPGNGPPLSDPVWRVLEARLLIAFAAEDHKNTAMIKAYVAAKGWPTISNVGAEASASAWLLVQHADADPAFQLNMLRLMEPLAAKGEVSKSNYALLYDRVMLVVAGKQRYGTQATCEDGKRVALPVEDMAKVDPLRAGMGLGTLADNFVRMDKLYGPCPPDIAGPNPPKK